MIQLPESAPFSEAQRAYLSGLLTGLLHPTRAANDATLAQSGEAHVDAPWHDMTMALSERMQLAAGRPRQQRLYAAMGQQDCGQCGYNCQGYAEALHEGKELDGTRCVPGGRETRKQIRLLLEQVPSKNDAITEVSLPESKEIAATRTAATKSSGRNFPFLSTMLRRQRLTHMGSSRLIAELAFDLAPAEERYEAGDALGVYVANDPTLVHRLLRRLGAHADDLVSLQGRAISARELLTTQLDLSEPSEALLEILALRAQGDTLSALQQLTKTGPELGCDVLELLARFDEIPLDLTEFQRCALPLQPRLYSIASAPSLHPKEAHLVVALVRYQRGDRRRDGVASSCLTQRLRSGARIPAYLQKNPHFRLPGADQDLIMIGPGTGVAPFIGFIDERRTLGARGRNWLFFGNPHRRSDFLYESRLLNYLSNGSLQGLDLAFSRDNDFKVYVQHRMQERAHELWRWIDGGAVVAVCGDAQRMAVDVNRALLNLIAEQSGKGEAYADQYVSQMSNEGRYRRDCY